MNIGGEAAGAGGGGDADWVLAEGSAGETGDASRDYGGNTGQVGRDLEQAGFAHSGAGYQLLDEVAELTAGEGLRARDWDASGWLRTSPAARD